MKQQTDYDIVIIGGGIVGLATAYKIATTHPAVRIAVLEKETQLAAHQTGRNSGVIHSGLYYKPGSVKAKTCTKGRKELVAFAKEHGIAHDICGKVIVATRQGELASLQKIYESGRRNKIEGLEKVGAGRIKEIEPEVEAVGGLVVPCTGIIDFVQVCDKMAELVKEQSADNHIFCGHKVTAFEKHDFYTKVLTSKRDFTTRYVINCAGLQCDRIAKMDGLDPGMRIIPFRGDYYELTEEARTKVKNLIYPVPDPAFPFLGVHFTRMIDGSVECGPNAVFSFRREGYRKTDFDFRDTLESLAYTGTWRLFLKHWRYGLAEYVRAFSKKRFLAQLQRLVPSLQDKDIHPGKAGVRAQALGPKGQLIDDFKIETHGKCIHVLNAPSPAATASLAIGEQICLTASRQFGLPKTRKTVQKKSKKAASGKDQNTGSTGTKRKTTKKTTKKSKKKTKKKTAKSGTGTAGKRGGTSTGGAGKRKKKSSDTSRRKTTGRGKGGKGRQKG